MWLCPPAPPWLYIQVRYTTASACCMATSYSVTRITGTKFVIRGMSDPRGQSASAGVVVHEGVKLNASLLRPATNHATARATLNPDEATPAHTWLEFRWLDRRASPSLSALVRLARAGCPGKETSEDARELPNTCSSLPWGCTDAWALLRCTWSASGATPASGGLQRIQTRSRDHATVLLDMGFRLLPTAEWCCRPGALHATANMVSGRVQDLTANMVSGGGYKI